MDAVEITNILGIVRDEEEAVFLTELIKNSNCGNLVSCVAVTSYMEGLIQQERRVFPIVIIRFSLENASIFDYQFQFSEETYYIGLIDRNENVDPALLAQKGIEAVCVFENTAEFRTSLLFHICKALESRSDDETPLPYLESRYENLVQALPDVVYELDTNGNFTFISNAIRLFGYEPTQLIGKHFSTILFPEDVATVDRSNVLREFKGQKTGDRAAPKLFNERRGLDRKTENLELRIRRLPSKSNPEMEAIATIISYGEVASAGAYRVAFNGKEKVFIGSVGIIRDVSLRRKSEDMLRRMYQAVDQSLIGIAILDMQNKIIYSNPHFFKITGYSPTTLIGKDISLFELTAGGARMDTEIMEKIQQGIEWQGDVQLKGARGDAIWNHALLSPVKTPDENVTHYLLIIEDITEKKRVEFLIKQAKDQAEEMNRQKNIFLSNVSHEIRTPLSGIKSMTELLYNSNPTEEQGRRLEMIKESTDILSTMLNDILEYSELEAGRIDLNPSETPISTIFEENIKTYQAMAEKKGLVLTRTIVGNTSFTINVDGRRIDRIISILVENAIKFTEKGYVAISLEAMSDEKLGTRLHVTVRDTGIGIPDEYHYRLFRSFTQIDSTFSKRYRGLGLGLVIAKEIVEKMGGELWFKSEEGKGSLFDFFIPIGQVIPAYSEARMAISPAAFTFSILIADDNEINREYIAYLLRSAGHNTAFAENGHEVLTQLENQRFDLILMDIQMPGMDGVETAKRIRSYSGSLYDPLIPIIAFTAYGVEDIETDKTVFDGFMQKPIKINSLLEQLRIIRAKKH